MHVFTYGTLMFPEVWGAVVGGEYRSIAGTAAGFEIYRVAGAVFPGIIRAAADSFVPGVVYLNVDDAGLAGLDRFEDDFYDRQTLQIECADGETRAAEAYVVPERNRAVLSNEPWNGDDFVARGHLAEFIARFAGFARVQG